MIRALPGGLALVLAGCAASLPEPAVLTAFDPQVRRPADGAFTSGLRLRCAPEDAEVFLDGSPRGRCSDFGPAVRALRQAQGRLHRLEVKKAGFSTYQTYYDPGGTIIALNVTLSPLGHSEGKPR